MIITDSLWNIKEADNLFLLWLVVKQLSNSVGTTCTTNSEQIDRLRCNPQPSTCRGEMCYVRRVWGKVTESKVKVTEYKSQKM